MFEHWTMKKFPALFVGGGLSENGKARFENHLGQCSRCREEVRKMSGLTERLKADGVPFPSAEDWGQFSGRLHRALLLEKERRASSPVLSFPVPQKTWVLPTAAAFLLVLFSAALMMKEAAPPGDVLNRASVDADTLFAELAEIENTILDEAIGTDFPVPEDWMGLLTEAGDEDLEDLSMSLNRAEEEFWNDPDLLEEMIEEVLS